MSYTGNDTDHPSLTAWLQAHSEDKQLSRLTEAYTSAHARLEAHNGQAAEAQAKLTEIDALLVDATSKQRDSLLTKRAGLAAEIDSLPATLATLRNRHAVAHLQFLQKVAQAARAEVEDLQARIVEPWAGVVETRKALARLESGLVPTSAETNQARAALLQEDREQVVSIRPLIEQRDAASRVLKVAQMRAETRSI